MSDKLLIRTPAKKLTYFSIFLKISIHKSKNRRPIKPLNDDILPRFCSPLVSAPFGELHAAIV